MIELLVFGGLGYAIAWYKSVTLAVRVGVVLALLALGFGLIAMLFSVGLPGFFPVMGELVAMIFAGERAVWVWITVVGFSVLGYVIGVRFAMSRRQTQEQAG